MKHVTFFGSSTVMAHMQVVIPRSLRKELGIQEGASLVFAKLAEDHSGFNVGCPAIRAITPTALRPSASVRSAHVYGTVLAGSRGQVTIPRALTSDLGIGVGTRLLFIKGSRERMSFRACLPESALTGLLPTEVFQAGSESTANTDANESADIKAKAEFLKSVRFFSLLDVETRQHIAAKLSEEKYQPGDVILHAGEPCLAMFVVVQGLVKHTRISPDGRVQVLKVIGPSKVIRLLAVLEGGPSMVDTVALEETILYRLARKDLLAFLDRSPALLIGLIHHIAEERRYMIRAAEDLAHRPVRARLARLILDQTDMVQRLSRDDMAAMIGTVREVVARALHELEAEGAVGVDRGKLTVINRDMLLRFIG